MSDYISRQAAVNRVKYASINDLLTGKWSDDLSAADVRENVRGHWVADRYCSVCDFDKHDIDCCCGMPQNYCPNCGADMRGEQNE